LEIRTRISRAGTGIKGMRTAERWHA